MKNIILILFLPFWGSFNQKDTTEFSFGLNESFKVKTENVIEDIKRFLETLPPETRSTEKSEFFKKLNKLEEAPISRIKLVVLDEDKFYESPSPETLLLSLYEPDDQVVMVGEDKTEKFLLFSTYYNERWVPSEMKYEHDIFTESWLNNELLKSKNKDFVLFKFLAREFYIITDKKDRTKIFSPVGEEIDIDELCEFIVDKIKNMREASGDLFKMKF